MDDYFSNLYRGTTLDDPENYGGESPFQPETICITDETTGDTYGYSDTEYGREAALARLSSMDQSFHVASANPYATQRLGIIPGSYAATYPTNQGPHQGINLDDIPSYDLGSYADASSDDDNSGAPATKSEPEEELPPPPQLVATIAEAPQADEAPAATMTKQRGAIIDRPTPPMKRRRTF